MITISETRSGLGSEHPLCDKIQLIMIILFFIAWAIDTFSFYIKGYSTVVSGLISFPILLLPAILLIIIGLYLVSESHKVIFGEKNQTNKLINTGVYTWVRHPMYLGILLFCLGFFFLSPSIFSLVIWIIFFILYNRMAAFEEKDLVKILGNQYISYQNQVSRWIPKIQIKK